MNDAGVDLGQILGKISAVTGGVVLCLGLYGCTSIPAPGPTANSTQPAVAPKPVPSPSTEDEEPETRKRARLRLELAASYFDQGQTNVALEELKQVLALDPGFADAYNLRGLIYMRLNDTRQAEESFRRALSLSAGDSATLHNYGWFLCETGQPRQAIE